MVKKAVKIEEIKKDRKITSAPKPETTARSRYFEATGGRKTALARIRLFNKSQGVLVNGKDYKDYFRSIGMQQEVMLPLVMVGVKDKVSVSVLVSGGGIAGQATAVSHGIARALTLLNSDFRKPLRHAGLLTRDARMVERKKYGLKKARRAPQWAKR